MGKGLSPLQKRILQLAADDKEAEERLLKDGNNSGLEWLQRNCPNGSMLAGLCLNQNNGVDDESPSGIPLNHYRITAIRIYADFYGVNISYDEKLRRLRPVDLTHAQQIAVSKACKRLVARGLLRSKRANGEWPLTKAGYVAVKPNGYAMAE